MYKYRFYDVNPIRMITVFHKDRATPTRKLDRNKVVPLLFWVHLLYPLLGVYEIWLRTIRLSVEYQLNK